MTAKQKKIIEYTAIGIGILILLWLVTRSSLVNPKAASNASVPAPVGSVGGANNYNPGGSLTLPDLSGFNIPVLNVPSSSKCSGCKSAPSCGCDPNNPASTFAASITDALNGYQKQINANETAYNAALFGALPVWLTQYIVSSDPTGGGSQLGGSNLSGRPPI